MGRMKPGEVGQKEGAAAEASVPAPPRRNTVRTITFAAPSHVAGEMNLYVCHFTSVLDSECCPLIGQVLPEYGML